MRIGVIADSHDRLPALREAVSMLVRMNVEAILHAGDFVAPFAAKLLAPPEVPPHLPVHVCFGNNDGERAGLQQVLPQLVEGTVKLELGGRMIAMNHYIDWFKPEELADAEIVVSGHTHEVVNETREGKLYLNPGECCGWLTDRCTCAVVETEGPTAQVLDVPV